MQLSIVSCTQSIKETKDYKDIFQQLNTLDKIDRKVEVFMFSTVSLSKDFIISEIGVKV
jgi:hypothetical protein